jgi:hypothetical protein
MKSWKDKIYLIVIKFLFNKENFGLHELFLGTVT